LFEDFVKILCGVDVLVLAEVYPAGESPIVAADSRALVHALRVAGQSEVVFVEDMQDMRQTIMQVARDGDVVVTMGAGSIGTAPTKLLGLSNVDATGKMPAMSMPQSGES
jgi:UDP-N-acetylmuramate--alanine ligase